MFELFDKINKESSFRHRLSGGTCDVPSSKLWESGEGQASPPTVIKGTLLESAIDFPQNDLPTDIWNKTGGTYVLKPEVKQHITDLLNKYPTVNLIKMSTRIDIVGSLTTNTYLPDADLDVHCIIPRMDEDIVKECMKFYSEHRDTVGAWVGLHPVEVYIQTNENQELLAEGIYDFQKDIWLQGPTVVKEDFNPYDSFSDVFEIVQKEAGKADSLLGELKRDTIDFETIQKYLKGLDMDMKIRVHQLLLQKLQEIEQDIESLYKLRKEWVLLRHDSSKPTTSEEALNDIGLVAKWKSSNAVFKYLVRYRYVKIIQELYKLMEDGLDAEDVHRIGSII